MQIAKDIPSRMYVKKRRRSGLRRGFLAYIIGEIAESRCVSYFSIVPKERKSEMEEKKGRYGLYGGQYIPETLIPAVQELEQEYEKYKNDPAFQAELKDLMENYAGQIGRASCRERV